MPFNNVWPENTLLSVDWHKAEIADAIAMVGAQTSYDLCFNRDGTSNPAYSLNHPNGVCQNSVKDDVSGAATLLNEPFQNLSMIETSGVDANLSWRANIADLGLGNIPGALSMNVSASKLFEFQAQEFRTAPALENAGTLARGGMFDWRLVTSLRVSAQVRCRISPQGMAAVQRFSMAPPLHRLVTMTYAVVVTSSM